MDDYFTDGWTYEFSEGEVPFEGTMTKDVAYELHLDMNWVDPETAKDFSVVA